MSDFTGRAALITGASGAIGRAVARRLADRGAAVGLQCHSHPEDANRTAADIQAKGGRAFVLPADLSKPEDAASLVSRLVEHTGRLDILFNNAGSPVRRAKMEECPLELWNEILTVNLTSAFLVTKAAIPHLRSSGHGVIINNLSLSVQTGGANGAGPYGIAKGGLQVMTRTLSRELAPAIRTNAIMPGVIETRHHEMFTTAERMAQYRAETPLGRNGTAEDVAAAVVFLMSDEAKFLNGAILDINGGRFLR